MPSYKKRRLHKASGAASLAPPAPSSALIGGAREDSIESCLAEMSAPMVLASASRPTDPPVAEKTSTWSNTDSLLSRQLWDPTLTGSPHPMSRSNRERIQIWNRAMRLWQTAGKYTQGLLPPFDVEVTRHFKVQALSSFLLESCPELKMPAFERWLIDAKLEEGNRNSTSADPVLSLVRVDHNCCQRLLEEICETGMKRAEARKLVQDLCRRTETAHREIAQQRDMNASRAPLKKGDRIDLEGVGKPVLTLVYRRKSWAKPFCIKLNSTHYDKLREMFIHIHQHSQGGDLDEQQPPLRWKEAGKPTKLTHAFHEILMVLLLRYSSLSGGQLLLDLRGGGMQGAIHGQVFRVLAEFFPKSLLLECFASPLNAYLPCFGSAFRDELDWHFGSVGSFLTETIQEGCCEANPPFSPGMMTAMAERIEHNLALSDERKKALTFVVVVPHAGDDADHQRAAAKRFGSVSLKRMTTSEKCRLHILLPAKEHGYVEGAQHMRPTRFKASLYATSVIILQSKKARKQALNKELLETKIRQAFVSRHEAEVEQRKRKGGASDGEYSLSDHSES